MKKLFAVVLLLIGLGMDAQSVTDTVAAPEIRFIEINGTVSDLSPLPKVVVFEKGSKDYAVTDEQGKFKLRIPIEHFANPVTIRFEVIGMHAYETQVAANTKQLYVTLRSSDAPAEPEWTTETEAQSITVSDVIYAILRPIVKKQLRDYYEHNERWKQTRGNRPK